MPALAGLRWRLRAGRDLAVDLALVARAQLRRAGAAARRVGAGAHRLWMNRPLSFRRRAVAVVLVLGLYAVLRLVAVPGLSCSVSPAKDCPPTDDAIGLVPADAYAYLHLDLDRSDSQVERALALVDRLPLLTRGAGSALSGELGLPAPQEVLSEPWLGDEIAAAILPLGDARPGPVLLLAVEDSEQGRRFLGDLAGDEPGAPSEYRDTPLYSLGELELAELDGFLALGEPGTARALIDVHQGEGDSLEGSALADQVRADLPSERLADAYLSPDGIVQLLAGRGGLAEQLDTFADFGASRGLGAALVAHDDGLELDLVSVLDPEEAKANPGFFAAFPSFDPSLAGELPEDALAYLGIANPGETAQLLLEQADAAAPGIASAFDRFNRDLRRSGGIDLERELLPLLGGEGAVAISAAGQVPELSMIFNGIDEDRVRTAVAQLGAPLIGGVRPEQTGRAPSVSEERIGDVVAQRVRLSPTLEVSYAVFDGKLVLSTGLAGVRHAIEGEHQLRESPEYRAVTSGADGVSALVFLNLEGLVELAEPRGLAEIAPYVTFKPDIARLKALGITVSSGEERLRTRAFLEIK